MCGSEDQLFNTEVEGAKLNLCTKCSKYGKVIRVIRAPVKFKKNKQVESTKVPEVEKMLLIVSNCAQIIKQKREKLGLKQEDFAKKLNEKESIIQHIENGKFDPSFKLARKLEKVLNVVLIEEHEEKHDSNKKEIKREHFTMADFIKKR